MRKTLIIAAAAIAVLALAATALAVTTTDVDLRGGGGTIWDPAADAGTNADCPAIVDDTTANPYTPVDDGGIDIDGDNSADETDAYDGGWMLTVNGGVFKDPDDQSAKKGQTIKPGARKLGGMRVSRTDTALRSAPALRMLVSLKNAAGHAKTAVVGVYSDFGADDDEVVKTSSNHDRRQQTSDRWLVERDSAASDPTNTLVFSGKGGNGVDKVVDPLQNGNGCDIVRYNVRVPGNSTKSLLFFAEMHRIAGANKAVQDAKKYDHVNAGSKLLKGLSSGVKKKISNWDF